ncbi:hypothetical protein ACFTXM_22250 [Streptomyces sp. NPDC056930]
MTGPWERRRGSPRLRVHHEGREAGVMLLGRAGAVQEVVTIGRRCGAE